MEDKNKFEIGVLGIIIGMVIATIICLTIIKIHPTPLKETKPTLYRAINLETNTIAVIKSNIYNNPNAYMSGNMVFVDENDTISNQDPDCMMYTILEPIN